MPNTLSFDKQCAVISALAEGSSIRSVERITGIHRDTIMRLGVRVGQACDQLMDEMMRELNCRQIQVDEIWGFVGKKQRRVTPDEEAAGLGDVWTFVALDPETKIVPSYVVGKRDFAHTVRFTTDLASRMKNRIQLSSDGMTQYLAGVEDAFGTDVDYGQIVKVYGGDPSIDIDASRRYSPPPVTAIRKTIVCGVPNEDLISTSMVEQQNLTLRMHCRRLTRLTNAFSKKLENFRASIGLFYAYYNLVKIHRSIRCTPAMAAGVASSLWKVEDLVDLARS
jgi:IS1 family transposase